MDTVRVDISYRPLRIGWVIQAGDLAGFRTAVRYSHALWGGRFNPVIIADRKGEARRLVDLFRVDLLVPVGNNDVVKQFPKDYPHVINPFFQDPVFIKGSNGDGHWAQEPTGGDGALALAVGRKGYSDLIAVRRNSSICPGERPAWPRTMRTSFSS